jgi:hypothetical protein
VITVPIFRTRRENVALRQKIADLQIELREERLDPITALPTRAYWTRLAEWQYPRTAAVVLIDLDPVDRTTRQRFCVLPEGLGRVPVRDMHSFLGGVACLCSMMLAGIFDRFVLPVGGESCGSMT